MFHRRPLVINQLEGANYITLARLAGLEGASRAILVGIIPIMLYNTLGSKFAVSAVYLIGACVSMCVTLNLARIERVLPRRWLVTLAAILLIIAAALMWVGTSVTVTLGIGFRASAASIFTVCLSLYIMDHIHKNELTTSESKRMLYAGAVWLLAPVTGSWLWSTGNINASFIMAILFGASVLVYFWRLRIGSNVVLRSAKSTLNSPVKLIPRYFSQRKLRIAYLISISRSSFWVCLFVYGPIYVVEAGLPIWMGGALLSAVSGLLFISPVIGRLAAIHGTRKLVITGLVFCAINLCALAALGKPQPLGLFFWILAALGAVILDVLGNIPFMRSVKPRERASMTVVFSTWREGSELVTPALAALVLLVAPLNVFYLLIAILLLTAAYFASFLPRRM